MQLYREIVLSEKRWRIAENVDYQSIVSLVKKAKFDTLRLLLEWPRVDQLSKIDVVIDGLDVVPLTQDPVMCFTERLGFNVRFDLRCPQLVHLKLEVHNTCLLESDLFPYNLPLGLKSLHLAMPKKNQTYVWVPGALDVMVQTYPQRKLLDLHHLYQLEELEINWGQAPLQMKLPPSVKRFSIFHENFTPSMPNLPPRLEHFKHTGVAFIWNSGLFPKHLKLVELRLPFLPSTDIFPDTITMLHLVCEKIGNISKLPQRLETLILTTTTTVKLLLPNTLKTFVYMGKEAHITGFACLTKLKMLCADYFTMPLELLKTPTEVQLYSNRQPFSGNRIPSHVFFNALNPLIKTLSIRFKSVFPAGEMLSNFPSGLEQLSCVVPDCSVLCMPEKMLFLKDCLIIAKSVVGWISRIPTRRCVIGSAVESQLSFSNARLDETTKLFITHNVQPCPMWTLVHAPPMYDVNFGKDIASFVKEFGNAKIWLF